MTINNFAPVSLTPPLVCWCIDRSSAPYQPFSRAQRFAVTVLSGSHRI